MTTNITPTAASYTIRNDRTAEELSTNLTPAELAAEFAKLADRSSWLWFHMLKVVQQHQPARPEMVDMIGFISDSFVMAAGRGLKNPMIRLGVKEDARRYKLYLSARGTICIKGGNVDPGTNDPVGDEEYIGCLMNGKFLPASDGPSYGNRPKPVAPKDQKFIDALTADPVGFFAKCSKDMNRCCYCNQPLEDARSKEVGYGRTCADRWGLPWGEVSKGQEVPSFASLWAKAPAADRMDIRGICQSIRENPKSELNWLVLRDKLEDAGWPENRLPSMPTGRVKMPRA